MKVALELGFLRLKEHPSRPVYLVASLVVTVLAWLVLSAVASKMSTETKAGTSSIITVMAERNGRSLPLRYVQKLRDVEGVADVAFMTFIPVMCREPATVATLNAWEIPADRLHAVLGDNTPTSAISSWQGNDRNVLSGSRLAADCGWTSGTTIEPMDLFSSRPLQITVSAILPPSDTGGNDQIAFAHYDYVNRMVPESDRDTIRVARVYVKDGFKAADLAARLEQAFASEVEPIQANPAAESEGLLSRFGSISMLLWLVAAALAACTLLVFVSSFAHMAAERRASMATLQAIGFRRSHLQAGIAIEIAVITTIGVFLGTLLALALLQALNPYVSIYLGSPRPLGFSYVVLAVGAIGLMLVSAAVPFRTIAHVTPADRNAA